MRLTILRIAKSIPEPQARQGIEGGFRLSQPIPVGEKRAGSTVHLEWEQSMFHFLRKSVRGTLPKEFAPCGFLRVDRNLEVNLACIQDASRGFLP